MVTEKGEIPSCTYMLSSLPPCSLGEVVKRQVLVFMRTKGVFLNRFPENLMHFGVGVKATFVWESAQPF